MVTGIIEGVCSVIHTAPRTEIKGLAFLLLVYDIKSNLVFFQELHILRDILMHKYGREFSIAVMENRDGCVSNRVSFIY
jgi:vacuolar protein sorting-associated protein IST1